MVNHETSDLFFDDLEVPVGHVIGIDQLLTQVEARFGIAHRIGIEAQIETASGFTNLREIASASPRLETLVVGMGDYAASMHMPLASIGADNAAFAPSAEEIAWARRVIETYEAAVAEGRGAVGSDEMMIDAANIRMARSTLRASGQLQLGGREA